MQAEVVVEAGEEEDEVVVEVEEEVEGAKFNFTLFGSI